MNISNIVKKYCKKCYIKTFQKPKISSDHWGRKYICNNKTICLTCKMENY